MAKTQSYFTSLTCTWLQAPVTVSGKLIYKFLALLLWVLRPKTQQKILGSLQGRHIPISFLFLFCKGKGEMVCVVLTKRWHKKVNTHTHTQAKDSFLQYTLLNTNCARFFFFLFLFLHHDKFSEKASEGRKGCSLVAGHG